MVAPSDVGRTLAAAARTINHSHSVDETLQTIGEVARHSIPGFDEVGISTLHKDGSVETRAFTGDLVLRLDELQYSLCPRRQDHKLRDIAQELVDQGNDPAGPRKEQ